MSTTEFDNNILKLAIPQDEYHKQTAHVDALDYLLKDYDGLFDDVFEENIIDHSDYEAFDFELYRQALDTILAREEKQNVPHPKTGLLREKLELVNENSKRIKFLLDEIETFLPFKK